MVVFIAYVHKPPINNHADKSSWARGLNFGLSLYQSQSFMYASNEGSGESEPSMLCNAISTKISCAGALSDYV